MGAVDGGFVRSGAIFELAKKGGGKGLGRGRIVQEFVAKNCGVELKTNCLRVGLRVRISSALRHSFNETRACLY